MTDQRQWKDLNTFIRSGKIDSNWNHIVSFETILQQTKGWRDENRNGPGRRYVKYQPDKIKLIVHNPSTSYELLILPVFSCPDTLEDTHPDVRVARKFNERAIKYWLNLCYSYYMMLGHSPRPIDIVFTPNNISLIQTKLPRDILTPTDNKYLRELVDNVRMFTNFSQYCCVIAINFKYSRDKVVNESNLNSFTNTFLHLYSSHTWTYGNLRLNDLFVDEHRVPSIFPNDSGQFATKEYAAQVFRKFCTQDAMDDFFYLFQPNQFVYPYIHMNSIGAEFLVANVDLQSDHRHRKYLFKSRPIGGDLSNPRVVAALYVVMIIGRLPTVQGNLLSRFDEALRYLTSLTVDDFIIPMQFRPEYLPDPPRDFYAPRSVIFSLTNILRRSRPSEPVVVSFSGTASSVPQPASIISPSPVQQPTPTSFTLSSSSLSALPTVTTSPSTPPRRSAAVPFRPVPQSFLSRSPVTSTDASESGRQRRYRRQEAGAFDDEDDDFGSIDDDFDKLSENLSTRPTVVEKEPFIPKKPIHLPSDALTPEQEAKIRKKFEDAVANPGKQEFLVIENESISSNNFLALNKHVWLSDEIINAFGVLYRPKAQEAGCFIYNSLIVTLMGLLTLTEWTPPANIDNLNSNVFADFDTRRANRLTRRKFIEYNKLFLPAHVNMSHWILGVVDIRQRRISVYDSHPDLHTATIFASSCQKWIASLPGGGMYDISGPFAKDMPRQTDDVNCAVFTCVNIAALIAGVSVKHFDSRNATEARSRIALQLMEKNPDVCPLWRQDII